MMEDLPDILPMHTVAASTYRELSAVPEANVIKDAADAVMTDAATVRTPKPPAVTGIDGISPESQRCTPVSSANAPRISVIVVTYNGQKWLDNCLGRLYGKDNHLNIIVVDNASSDGTPDMIREKWPEVKLIEPGKNLGFGQANNIGLRHALDAGCDYAYLLNQDAWIEPHDIFRLAAIHANHPGYGVLSPMQMRADLSTPDPNFERCANRPNCPRYAQDLSDGKELKEVYDVNKVMAAHWLLSAEAIERVGGFAPIFAHYGEDYNFLDRLSFHGLKAGICPAVKAVHDRGERTNETLPHAVNRAYNSIFLPLACDITKTAFNAFMHGFRALGKESLRQTRKYGSLRPLTNLLRPFTYIGKISDTRSTTKIRGPHYI